MTEVVIVSAVRTPIGRIRGALASVRPDDLAALVIREAVARSGVEPAEIEEVYLGCANQAGEDNRNVARMAALLAGLPQEVAGLNGEPAVRQRSHRREPGGAGDSVQRRRNLRRRRRGEHDARALFHTKEFNRFWPIGQHNRLRYDPRLALS